MNAISIILITACAVALACPFVAIFFGIDPDGDDLFSRGTWWPK